MKKLTFACNFILIILFCSGKSPAFILYDDGTWEKASGGSFDSSSSYSANSPTGSLEVIASLKMQRGGAKPVASEDVYLITQSFAEYMRGKGLGLQEYPDSYIQTYSWGVKLRGYGEFGPYLAAAESALRELKVAQDVTDLSGKAEFHGIKPGKYYVMLRTSLGAEQGCAWCVPVIIDRGRNKINLRNENVNEDLLHKELTPLPTPSTSSPLLDISSVDSESSSSLSPSISIPSVPELPKNREEPGFDLDPKEVKKEIVRKYQAGEITKAEAVEMMKKLRN